MQVTNASGDSCDAQSNVCLARPVEVSPIGSPTPLTIGKASVYHVYAGTLASLQIGVYDHAATPGLCGIVDPAPGNGGVTLVASLPENAYFLAVADNAVGESTYGISTGGTIPAALTTCP